MSGTAPGRIEGAADPAPNDRIEGWKAIAAALKVHEQTARSYADPMRKFRLPVRVNYRNEPYVTRWNLQRWIDDNDLPWGLHKPAARR
jgi:hypothetical protein